MYPAAMLCDRSARIGRSTRPERRAGIPRRKGRRGTDGFRRSGRITWKTGPGRNTGYAGPAVRRLVFA